MRVLVLEPFGGGSHAAWCAGWEQHSRHALTVMSLPAVHWKWRSRHAALTLADKARGAWSAGQRFDAVVCSEMLDVPAWKGLVGGPLAELPTVTYFHENQLTYPLSAGQRRDYHFGYTNILSVLASDETWFNSEFHRSEFAAAAVRWLRRMPDYRHLDAFQDALSRTRVMPPGIDPQPIAEAGRDDRGRPGREDRGADRRGPCRPMRLGWVARWEHDKRPDLLVALVRRLLCRGIPMELVLLGQRFAREPCQLERLREVAAGKIRYDAFAPSRAEYLQRLLEIDVVVSTADHEFFGIGVCEAIDAGAVPLLPNRLAYPEVLSRVAGANAQRYLYDTLDEADRRLGRWLSEPEVHLPPPLSLRPYHWPHIARQYDERLECLVGSRA